jgi:hypothetical protein
MVCLVARLVVWRSTNGILTWKKGLVRKVWKRGLTHVVGNLHGAFAWSQWTGKLSRSWRPDRACSELERATLISVDADGL